LKINIGSRYHASSRQSGATDSKQAKEKEIKKKRIQNPTQVTPA